MKGKAKQWIDWNIRRPLYYFIYHNLRAKLLGHKPMKWGIYLPLLSAKWWSDRYQEFHVGHVVTGSLGYLLNLTILLKVFDAPTWMYPVILFGLALSIWILGRTLKRWGFWKHFMDAQFKDTNLEAK